MVCVVESGDFADRTGSIVNGDRQAKFPKSAHLLKHADFQRVYQNGKRHFSGNLTAFYLRRNSDDGASPVRVGFTVGKVLGGAVERNRIRRRTREAVRFHLLLCVYLSRDDVHAACACRNSA